MSERRDCKNKNGKAKDGQLSEDKVTLFGRIDDQSHAETRR
jgi:hypothetical protein